MVIFACIPGIEVSSVVEIGKVMGVTDILRVEMFLSPFCLQLVGMSRLH